MILNLITVTIYALKFSGGYQGKDIKGHFSTLKKAEEARKKELEECCGGGTPDDWSIEDIEVK